MLSLYLQAWFPTKAYINHYISMVWFLYCMSLELMLLCKFYRPTRPLHIEPCYSHTWSTYTTYWGNIFPNIQSSAVITQSNITWYCTHHCRNWGRISVQRLSPQKTSHSSPWRANYGMSFVNILQKNWLFYIGTTLYNIYIYIYKSRFAIKFLDTLIECLLF